MGALLTVAADCSGRSGRLPGRATPLPLPPPAPAASGDDQQGEGCDDRAEKGSGCWRWLVVRDDVLWFIELLYCECQKRYRPLECVIFE